MPFLCHLCLVFVWPSLCRVFVCLCLGFVFVLVFVFSLSSSACPLLLVCCVPSARPLCSALLFCLLLFCLRPGSTSAVRSLETTRPTHTPDRLKLHHPNSSKYRVDHFWYCCVGRAFQPISATRRAVAPRTSLSSKECFCAGLQVFQSSSLYDLESANLPVLRSSGLLVSIVVCKASV